MYLISYTITRDMKGIFMRQRWEIEKSIKKLLSEKKTFMTVFEKIKRISIFRGLSKIADIDVKRVLGKLNNPVSNLSSTVLNIKEESSQNCNSDVTFLEGDVIIFVVEGDVNEKSLYNFIYELLYKK